MPTEIVTDLSGNILVRSATANPFAPQQIYRFTSGGRLSGQVSSGEDTLIIAAMATDPATGLIWSLSANGNLSLIDPSTLQGFLA